MEQLDMYYEAWIHWVATDRKFLPETGGLLDQPLHLMKLFFLFDSIADKITKQLLEEKRKREAPEEQNA